MYAGKPIVSNIASQLNGNFILRNEFSVVSGGLCDVGKINVFGTGTPTLSARALLKNFSSALHQKGLLITAVPDSAAFFKYAR